MLRLIRQPRMMAVIAAVLATPACAWAQGLAPAPMPAVRAGLTADRTTALVGQPVWAHFTLSNLAGEPVTFKVPDVPATDEPVPLAGLPLSHVFSGLRYSALVLKDAQGEEWDHEVTLRPQGPVPMVRLGPYASVGIRVDLSRYYRSLRRPGKYTLIWRPYYAAVESAPLTITVLAERQAIILTELGSMTLRFYYEEAPLTVQNFIELVEKQFYDRLTFHRIVPNVLIQGGDPRGDGQGGRPDGKRIKAEFSQIPFNTGTVGMARLPSDPDSASSQFFIALTRQTSFDGNQTAFGYLVYEESFETLRKIAAVPLDERGRPRSPVIIRAITLENVPGREPDAINFQPGGPISTRPAIMSGYTDTPAGVPHVVVPIVNGPATRPAGNGG